MAENADTAPMMRVVLAGLSCVAAAWIVAGSTGLLEHTLRRTLALLGIGVAAVAIGPLLKWSWTCLLGLVVAAALALWAIASPMPSIGVAGIAIALAFFALAYSGPHREVLWISCVSIAVFALYRAALVSIPWLWLSADWLGKGIGRFAGLITRRPLWIGATFAGLDFLVLTGTIWALWLACSPRPRRTRALYGSVVILGGHLGYLIVLSYSHDLLALVPEPAAQQQVQQPWSWPRVFHKAVPWNLPVLACAVHLLVIAGAFRWVTWAPARREAASDATPRRWRLAALAGACLLPIVTGLYPARLHLEGKEIVFYSESYADWGKPTHGQYGLYSGRMLGILPAYVESFGAHTRMSSQTTAEDLQNADVLVVYYPGAAWAEGQLERIWKFVREGGSLLLMGEHTIHDCNDGNRSSELLSPTGMRVPYDSAMPAVMGWDQSYRPLVHPVTAGLPDDHKHFGVSIGASLNVRWPASPLLVGRWGWTDFGDEGNKQGGLGNWSYDPGEKLGDIIQVAERRLGRGRVIAFGDTTSFMNTTFINTHEFMSRVLGYLSSDAGQAHSWWRQVLGVLIAAVLVTILSRRVDPWSAALVALGLAGSLTACAATNHGCGVFHPAGNGDKPEVAYLDATHGGAHWELLWRPNDVAGLVLTLMRNDYLPFSLPDLTAERLEGAALLISIAPSRAFSANECAVVRDFVTRGGVFLITVGHEESPASHSILSEFGFTVGGDVTADREPSPMGRFKSPYLRSGDRQAYVRFHSAWPVACSDPNVRVIANGRENLPVIMMRQVGAGDVVVVGDTGFLMNKNLEREDGQPIEGHRENSDFWQWFVTQLRGQEMWVPPSLREPADTGSDRLIPGQPLSIQGVQP